MLAVNLGTFVAGILISTLVLGLMPFLAFLFFTEKAPKPTRVTLSPFLRALETPDIKASIAFPAAAFDILTLLATASISSAFVMIILLSYPE